MSFTGDLEHLPIVDVIQLLHSTRKSGILSVKSRKGESQLVFKDGYIVSANHLNNTIRIGKILVELNAITPAILDRALQEQNNAGHERKPLIVTLLEKGLVKEGDAYRGLEQLIETTIVEILTWKRGTFILDVLPSAAADDYRYYPEKMNLEINVDTQSILMDSLRIFDEKVRDGELTEEELPEDEGRLISADDLGLADLDQLERKIPEVFSGLADADPALLHRQKIAAAAPGLSLPEREELVSFLGKCSAAAAPAGEPALRGGRPRPVIFFSADGLASHAIATVCKQAGMLVFTSNEEQDLDPIIAQALSKNSVPILVFDAPEQADGPFSAERLASLRRQKMAQYPQLCTIQLASPGDAAFSLHAYGDGVRAVLPKPRREEQQERFVADTIQFLTTFRSYLEECACERENSRSGWLKAASAGLTGLREAPEVASVLLACVAGLCERALTLIVRGPELIAEKGIGIRAGKEQGAAPTPGFRIPLAKPSLFRTVVEEGHLFCGATADAVVREHLFAAIGAPGRATVLLLPMKSRGKTLALIYGDFGDKEPAALDLDLLQIVARQAELVLENSLYRKKLEKP
ncbi:MAG: DUF4388 domain-containing protein [Geobacteraceae bacterium]|nr:DUF4388 domain-containing protein [Geobacteraceae bacterium]